MSKFNPSKLSSLQNETSALSNINTNMDRIKSAFDNTLSRDGTTPNAMGADLDMNSNRIHNLVEPINNTEPVRLIDLQNYADSFGLVPTATSADVGKILKVRDDFLGYDFGQTVIDTATNNVHPAVNDVGALGTTTYKWADLFLASGAIINFNSGDVTLTHAADTLAFGGGTSYSFDAVINPASNDGAALGTTALKWSDLFLASGAVVNFNSGDVTLTHAADTLTFAGATSGYLFDSLVAPSTNDGSVLGSTALKWSDLFLASGAVINFNSGDVTITHGTDTLAFAGGVNGYTFDNTIKPSSNDVAALGTTTLMWSDIFLASGAVVNFNNGDVVVTHSTGIWTVGTGDLRVTTAGTNSASVVTVGGTQTLTGKTLTSPTINTPTLVVNDDVFTVQDNADTTKKAQLQLSGITTGTTRTYTLPDASDTIAVLALAQVLTNKTINLTNNTLSGTTAQFNTALSDDDFATLTNNVILTNKTVNLTSNTLSGTTAQFNTALSDNDFATLAGTEVLTNKTVNLTSNTLSGTTAQFNTALSDNDFATLAGAEVLTNKSLTSPVITGTEDVQQAIKYTGVISPAQITASQNDYAPTGFSTAYVLRLDLNADWNLTGLAGGAAGREVVLHNISAFNLSLINNSASSSAANRFDLNGDEVIATRGTLTLWYDGSLNLWKKKATTGSGAGGGGGAPSTAQYIVAATDATLSAERLATDSTSITWDFSAGGVAKANLNVNLLTAETAPAIGDELAMYDVSASTQDKITLENMFKVVNGFTTDSSPDFTADYVPSYDASASGIKKVLLGNLGSSPRRTITSADTVVASDRNGLIEITSGTFSLAFTAAATIGSGFSCYILNNGTGDVTLDPNSTEQIDGVTSWVLYPGGGIRVFCTGTAWESALISAMTKQFDSSGTFTKPGAGSRVSVELWGGGGSGASGSAGDGTGGGGGGACLQKDVALSTFGATETITIGAGGTAVGAGNADGNAGGNTTIGSLFTIYGGGGGAADAAGSPGGGAGGGGLLSAGASATGSVGVNGGSPTGGAGSAAGNPSLAGGASVFGGGGGSGSSGTASGAGGLSIYGGGGGSGGTGLSTGAGAGGLSIYGGGGGGGSSDTGTGGTGGTSLFGGAGGNGGSNGGAPTNGAAPSGGGGGSENQTSGAGGAGRVIITVY